MAKKKSSTGKTDAASPQETAAKPYVVLARKYRPQTFDDLIGQDAMVTTLRNAFAIGRIAHGYMLTGVRGVGKTTTARILARALNYEREGIDKPTIDMPELGRHCAEIMESRHPDVIEMDAASNTSVDNMREIIESARYRPLLARYKVFIVDEVHMLSQSAFNALLKTLEEPPEHVKFIFATTEIRKVPVTVLSRCQRFDLRRVDVPALVQHFRAIAGKEGAEAEDAALALIARAAEGSVRDGLSILDQAIAYAPEGKIAAADVRAMLGLADRGRIFDLLEHLFRGEAGTALKAFGALHHDGADPVQVLGDLAEAVHVTARVKTVGAEVAGETLSAEEKRRAGALAERLSVPLLSRAWQMLLKGLDEAAEAPNPLSAAEMVLIRIAYTADLPAPDELMRTLGPPRPGAARGPAKAESPRDGAPVAEAEMPPSYAAVDEVFEQDLGLDLDDGREFAGDYTADTGLSDQPRSFDDVIALAGARRDLKLKNQLEEHVSLVKFDAAAGSIDLFLLPGAPPELANELREKLNRWTGRRWVVVLSKEPGAPATGPERRRREAEEIAKLKGHPAVAAVLAEFPDAKIAGIRPLEKPREDDTGTG